jgi:sigma-B regulation protein RsbU (phosphoserine phosphatase)
VQVLLGDVTGHGAGAAMVTAGVAAAYRAIPEQARCEGDVTDVMRGLNASLVDICAGAHHMTLAALEIDPTHHIARFWSAGAPAALVMHKDGRIDHLGAAGRPLGDPELVIGHAQIELAPGDRIFIFSDGLPEMNRSNGRQLGYRGVSRMLHDTLGRDNDQARAHLLASLDDVRKQQPQADDIAFVLIDLDGQHTELKAA